MIPDPTPQKLLFYINQARRHPPSFIPFIQKSLTKFVNDFQYQIAPGMFVQTNEGKKAWVQAIQFLRNQKPLNPFSEHKGLEQAAQFHADDMAQNNIFGHTGSNGSSMSERIRQFCQSTYGSYGQNITSEFKEKKSEHNIQMVLELIIDDGVKSRGHRQNVFSQKFNYAGIGVSSTSQYFYAVFLHSQNNLKIKQKQTIVQHKQQNNKKSEFGDLLNNEKRLGIEESNGRKIVSQNTSVSTSIKDGKTITKKTVKTTYNDGSVEEKVTIEEKK